MAAPAAALAAAVRTAWLEKTPAANSSCAFWKLAPVRRYREWIWKRAAGSWSEHQPRSELPVNRAVTPCLPKPTLVLPEGRSGPKVQSKLTFFSIMMPNTATAVKNKDTRIIITATAVFFRSAIRLNIQPLQNKRQLPTGSLFLTRLPPFWGTWLARAPWGQHNAHLNPQFGMPIACSTYITFWAKKTKKKTKKLNELSLLGERDR